VLIRQPTLLHLAQRTASSPLVDLLLVRTEPIPARRRDLLELPSVPGTYESGLT